MYDSVSRKGVTIAVPQKLIWEMRLLKLNDEYFLVWTLNLRLNLIIINATDTVQQHGAHKSINKTNAVYKLNVLSGNKYAKIINKYFFYLQLKNNILD